MFTLSIREILLEATWHCQNAKYSNLSYLLLPGQLAELNGREFHEGFPSLKEKNLCVILMTAANAAWVLSYV